MNFLKYIEGIDNWTSLNEKVLKDNDNQIKGDIFEKLTKYYFLFKPEYKSLLKNVWLGSEIPDKINKKLGIPSQDQGIDLIAQTNEGDFWSIQCKYHGDNNRKVTHREVSTFISLSFGIAKGIKHAIVSTTADDYAKLYRGKENIGFVLSDEWNKLDSNFFDFVRAKELNKEPDKGKPFKPFKHQERALKNAKKHFLKEKNTRGKLVFPCGAGKSLTGYWITRELKAKNIIIAVPSLALVKQTLEVYLQQSYLNNESLKWLCVCSDHGIGKADDVAIYTQDIGVPCVTDTDTIAEWLIKNKSKKTVVFTTYQSGEKIAEASRKAKISFDLGIMDEAHKTVGASDKLFSHLLFEKNISIDKRIFMTATERRYKGSSEDVLSMDDPDMYGDTFEQMTFKEAIESDILSDYKIITLFISDDEVKNLIDDNVLVKPKGSKWNYETEARTLASLIALRKAIKKYNINHSVTFHSSIAKANAFMQSQEVFTERYKQFSSVDAFHVAGSMPTAQRSKVIDAFANSRKAIITNARCLTEGVDVPSIDGVLFADPRKSTIDIVQAVGRALRKSKGKDFGYVILPVFTKSKTKEEIIKSDDFKDILMTLRALASNDERIIEYFRDKSAGKSSSNDSIIQFDIDEELADVIDEKQLVEQLELTTWEKLAKISWRPFEKAREYIQKFEFKSSTEFKKAWREGRLAFDIPSKPRRVYKDSGFISMPDFLGYEYHDGDWRPFEKARFFVRKLGLLSAHEWREYATSQKRPFDIPSSPANIYRNKGWKGFGDWLGTGTIATKDYVFRPFLEARKYARSLNLEKIADWFELEDKRPRDIPSRPYVNYKNQGWIHWGDFLNLKDFMPSDEDWMPFDKARAFVRKLGLKNTDDWYDILETDKIPYNIPHSPAYIYKNKGWKGIGDWIGTDRLADQFREYLDFKDAQKFMKENKITTANEWRKFRKANNIENIPYKLRRTYSDDWKGAQHFFGTEIFTLEEAKNFLKDFKIKSSRDYSKFLKTDDAVINLPGVPHRKYAKSGWIDWQDYLGYEDEKKPYSGRKNISYKEAKKIIKENNITSTTEYQDFKKQNKHIIIPSHPERNYKDQWKGWDDFLGKEN